ncbi:MAG: RNHCP domain-containing protein [Candidatus Doudnabacteria bacterium]|nr:RNHCP domain-containing protein [Candidatus Doudnabacteria bacterium]
MVKMFQKRIENFACKNCGAKVKGSGYTNHCPQCLWSKHVDINPGDRAEKCEGQMEPIHVEYRKGEYILTHKCLICGQTRKCKTSPEDSIETLAKLSESLAKKALS